MEEKSLDQQLKEAQLKRIQIEVGKLEEEREILFQERIRKEESQKRKIQDWVKQLGIVLAVTFPAVWFYVTEVAVPAASSDVLEERINNLENQLSIKSDLLEAQQKTEILQKAQDSLQLKLKDQQRRIDRQWSQIDSLRKEAIRELEEAEANIPMAARQKVDRIVQKLQNDIVTPQDQVITALKGDIQSFVNQYFDKLDQKDFSVVKGDTTSASFQLEASGLRNLVVPKDRDSEEEVEFEFFLASRDSNVYQVRSSVQGYFHFVGTLRSKSFKESNERFPQEFDRFEDKFLENLEKHLKNRSRDYSDRKIQVTVESF